MAVDGNYNKDIPDKTCSKTNISKFNIDFNFEEQQKSNTLISGTNSTGKSRLAFGICSILRNFNWRIICFDNTGIYKEISDIPTFYTVKEERNYDEESKQWFYPFPKSTMLFDTSLLIPDFSKGPYIIEKRKP